MAHSMPFNAESTPVNVNYPFGNPHKQSSEDTESYHSMTIDSKKLQYFYDPTSNFEESSKRSSSKFSESNLKRKNPLPPSYPYEEVKKLKQSLKFQNKPCSISDNQSIHSVDSFHTANEFQSICYEEGDFQKIIHQMQEQKPTTQSQKLTPQLEKHGPFPKKVNSNNHRQNNMSKQQNPHCFCPIEQFPFEVQQKQKIDDYVALDENIPIKQSNALNEIDIEELQNAQMSGEKYQNFEEKTSLKKIQKRQSIEDENVCTNADEEEGQIEISHIQNALNESELLDQEILELTRQLHKIQSSQEQLQNQHQFSQQCIRQQQILAQKYSTIQSKLKQLQSTQKNFTSQISNMHLFIKKTKQNSSYLKKELQFFKEKSKAIEEKERNIEEKEKRIQEKELNTSKNHSLTFGQNKLKPKTFHIKPKTPNNQTTQSRKYKELTFEYCLGKKNDETENEWRELEIDNQNTPPEYKLIYSFQHQNTILAIRLVDLVSNQSSRSSVSGKKPTAQGSFVKKNYQYLMDFSHNKYESQSKKLQSLSKELFVNLQQQRYICKQFTKKIQIFLMICEEETFIDLVKLVPLPNPIVFYVQPRFQFLKHGISLSQEPNSKQRQNLENEASNNQSVNTNRQVFCPQSLRNLLNLSKFMKTYIIKIEHMADVESIQKLMNLSWINAGSDRESKYFTIKAEESEDNSKKSIQLFYVKIEDCILQNSPDSNQLDPKHRYSLVFRVGSTLDNDLLVDLIEFLTFFTIY